MMQPMSYAHDINLFLADPDATDALGSALSGALCVGDTVLLSGPLGAGKSQLARAIIRARLGRMEDVPSPTFTLVQTYPDAGGDLWHSDLYRLTHPDEVIELGLDEAYAQAICLIEWPENLGRYGPQDAISVALDYGPDDTRRVRFVFAQRAALAAALHGFAGRG